MPKQCKLKGGKKKEVWIAALILTAALPCYVSPQCVTRQRVGEQQLATEGLILELRWRQTVSRWLSANDVDDKYNRSHNE